DLERNSDFTDLSDLLQTGVNVDALGRSIPVGAVLDPATTRTVAGGIVRDPFLGPATTCSAATMDFSAPGCDLNKIPAGRLDTNAINLLKLYPAPNIAGRTTQNFVNSPVLNEHRNSFDTRLDFNLSDKNQIFTRFSLVDDPQFIPSIFGGIADGGAFQEGDQTA